MTDYRAIMAAQNSADWYSMMFDIHGLRHRRSATTFLGLETPPRYHSWMTTLDPNAQEEHCQLIAQNAHRPKFIVKDAFDCLTLNDERFVEYFSATWIFASTVQEADTGDWIQIRSGDELSVWEQAWNAPGSPSDTRQFPDAILDRPDVTLWGRRSVNGFDAGVIANRSTDCIGLSNCFGQESLPAAATLCAQLSDGQLPVVGFESGDELKLAIETGFIATGTLRIRGRS